MVMSIHELYQKQEDGPLEVFSSSFGMNSSLVYEISTTLHLTVFSYSALIFFYRHLSHFQTLANLPIPSKVYYNVSY